MNANMEDIALMSNTELKEMCEELETQFKEKQRIVSENFQLMVDLSQQYKTIKDLLEKREGKKNDIQ